ncbi:hypothetical protein GHT06_011423 [Daphnia sinensis]|uniref:Uncharacterized protein n=1 Tax=Daphnia sinensis TaxID=1820382 RepID=A0AAD5PUK8_9CRUS|nr:hypothetical protein GHT06_011423 [Daphnia sinensis]
MSSSGDGGNDLQGSQRPPDDTEINLGLNQEEFPVRKISESPRKRKRSGSPSSDSSTSESTSASSSEESHSSTAKKRKLFKKKKKKKAEAEKPPTVISCKVLRHQAKPLLYLGTRMTDPDCKEALETALQLWGVAFNDTTKSRRRNIIHQENFDLSESNHLFGRYFLKTMVRSADDEAKLNAVNRNGGSNNNRHRRESRGGRHDHRKDRHPYRIQGDKGYGNKNPGFSQHSGYVPLPLKIKSPVVKTPTPVGGRLGSFASAWRRFSKDPWVLNIVSFGLQIEFLSTPTQKSPFPIK